MIIIIWCHNEMRYKILTKTNPEEASRLLIMAKEMVALKWDTYEDMAKKPASAFQPSQIIN